MLSYRLATPTTSLKCVRFIGARKLRKPSKKDKKSTSNVSKQPSVLGLKKQSVSAVLSDAHHHISPIVANLNREVQHELYSQFCESYLQNYGFCLEFKSSKKQGVPMEGVWYLPDNTELPVDVSCSYVTSVQERTLGVKKLLAPNADKITIFINNVGFKSSIVRQFVDTSHPAVLMSVNDTTDAWIKNPATMKNNRNIVSVEKCLHHQVWNHKVGYSSYKFAKETIECPISQLRRGLGVILFNRAFLALYPFLSAGKVVYQLRPNTNQKRSLKARYFSTILFERDNEKRDLSDVILKIKVKELQTIIENEYVENTPKVESILTSYDNPYRPLDYMPSQCKDNEISLGSLAGFIRSDNDTIMERISYMH